MKGRCQTCGATAPLEWFTTEPVARQMLVVALKMHQAVQNQLLGYLALFNPAGGTMQSKKALRLTKELAAMLAQGNVIVQGKVSRHAPPVVWAKAMEHMAERRDTLRLPLKNHNYLRQIAWSIADQEDARQEASRDEQQLSGNHRPYTGARVHEGPLPLEVALKEKAARSNGGT